MSKAATAAKARWNAKNYTQLKISVNPDIKEAFMAACAGRGVSMAGVLTAYMAEYAEMPIPHEEKTVDYSTRKKRREAVANAVRNLTQIMDTEEDYRDRIPTNLQGSEKYERADATVEAINEAIKILKDAF